MDIVQRGAPLVAAHVKGLSDDVQANETALLYPFGDAEAARRAINALLEDQVLADRLRQCALTVAKLRHAKGT